jgi:NAD(P)-dependent dehydrogenase (short-subunit alcohol dehydrogenase family)
MAKSSKHKVAIVTGGTRGIGLGITKELLKRGYKVVVCCRHQKELDAGMKAVKSRNVHGVLCDVGHEVHWENLVKEVMKKWKRIDVLVNNAGILIQKPLMETSWEEMEQVLHVNLLGAFLGMKACVPKMKKGARIVNVASVAGLKGFPQLAAYCSAKFGLIGLTKVAALDFAEKGIRVNVVCPGLIDTPMTKDIMGNKAAREGFLAQIPQGRAGKPEEIGAMVGFLADKESGYCTGGVYVVDGGMTV